MQLHLNKSKTNDMSYKQKQIHSMAFYLKRRYNCLNKRDSIIELKKIWAEMSISDMTKAYNIAYND